MNGPPGTRHAWAAAPRRPKRRLTPLGCAGCWLRQALTHLTATSPAARVFTDTYLRQPPRSKTRWASTCALLGQFGPPYRRRRSPAAIAHERHPDAEVITSFPGAGCYGPVWPRSATSGRADARGLKALAAPITRASGKKTVVLHRHIKNRRLAAVGPIWALGSLRASPGARRHYDTRRAAGDWNHQAQRHLFNKFLGQLHHCLQTGQLYDEHLAFPPPLLLAA